MSTDHKLSLVITANKGDRRRWVQIKSHCAVTVNELQTPSGGMRWKQK